MEIGVIMAEASVTFHAPVHYGTPVKVGVRTSKLGGKSMRVEQAIVHAQSGEVLATGYVILVAFDYYENETISIPDKMRKTIAEYEGLEI